jgi:predicted O-methyltransferase YrrM
MSLEEWYNENPSMKQDLKILYEMVHFNKPRQIVEIGTGHSTMTMAYALKCFMMDVKILTTDIDKVRVEYFMKKIDSADLSNYCILHTKDSIEFLNEINFISSYIEKIVDMIFIDSAHEYQKTLDEIIAANNILSSKGFIFIHDTTNGFVLAAIKKFLENNNLYIYSNFPTQCGLGVLKRK